MNEFKWMLDIDTPNNENKDVVEMFNSCIALRKVSIIKIMIESGIINTQNINDLLVLGSPHIASCEVVDFLVEYGLEFLHKLALDKLLRSYIINNWISDKIILLIDHGAGFYDNNLRIHNMTNPETMDFIINNRLDILDVPTLSGILQYYISNIQYYPDNGIENKIRLLIDHGAKMSENIVDLILLPDDLFFEMTHGMPYVVDATLIKSCIINKSIRKLEHFFYETTYNPNEYLGFLLSSLSSGMIDIFNFFIKIIDDQMILFILLLRIIYGCQYSHTFGGKYNIDDITEVLIQKIELTNDKLLYLNFWPSYMGSVAYNKIKHKYKDVYDFSFNHISCFSDDPKYIIMRNDFTENPTNYIQKYVINDISETTVDINNWLNRCNQLLTTIKN